MDYDLITAKTMEEFKEWQNKFTILPPGAKISPIPKKLTYLCSPYSNPNPIIREVRFQKVCKIASDLMRGGMFIYSPIAAHTHPIALAGDLPIGFDFWEQYDRTMISMCFLLLVVKMEGWEQSKGVTAEIKIANELGIPVEYLEVDDA